MSQIVGLIELEPDGTTLAEIAGPSDDATLDELFARLVYGETALGESDEPGCTVELSADLDVLSEDLSQAARKLLQELFLTHGGRR